MRGIDAHERGDGGSGSKDEGNEVFIVRQYNEQMTRYTNLSESRCSSRLSVLSGRKR